MMQLIHSFLQRQWKIEFASPAQFSDHMEDLSALGINSTNIELNNSSFDQYIQQLKPDIVVFDRFMMEEQFAWRVEKYCPEALRILNTEDLHSLRDARHKAIKQDKTFQPIDMHSDLAVREIAAILRSDLTLMISEFESELLQQQFNVPSEQLLYLPFMLPSITEVQQGALPTYEQRQHFVSIGNFRHAPNWDAVLQLKQTLWPAIRKQLPQAELHIYGAYPPPKATQLHNPKQGFLIKGWAEDAHQVMASARVCLAPLRFGAGIKGKLSDAMVNGTPSITTPIGAEGMTDSSLVDHDAKPLWNGNICQTDEEFIQSAVALYQDEQAWRESQQYGFVLANKRFDQTFWRPQLIERIQSQIDNLEAQRKQNFFGLMLRHHSLKSTQYMAQWIEAKNR